MRRRPLLFLTLPLALLTSAFASVAAAASDQPTFRETWVVDGIPSRSTLSSWTRLAGSRSYHFRITMPNPSELRDLKELSRFEQLQFQAGAYPEPDALPAWRELAARGAEWVGLDLQLPTDEQVAVLNEIGFTRISFVLSYIPDMDEGARLAQLRSAVSITFATSSFPRYDDRDLLLAIPATLPLTFAGTYWPSYTHMDVLNMLPHTKRLRITEAFPSEFDLPYLNNIRSLEEVSIRSSYAPPSNNVWKEITAPRIHWTCRDWLPSSEALVAFEASATANTPRRLTIEKDDLFGDEEAALRRLRIPVEWIRNVPLSLKAADRSHAK